jgi:hypothetical protein
MSETKKVDVYLSASRETLYDQGQKMGLTGNALDMFTFTGYEEKITYAVDMETGASIAVALNDFDLQAPKKGT